MSSPRTSGLLLATAVVAGLASAARASPEGSAVTLFASRPYAVDGQEKYEANVYELVSLFTQATTLGPAEDVRLVLRGWGRLAAGDAMFGSRGTGDVDLAYLEGRLANKRVLLRVGRQMFTEGAARNVQVDGVMLSASLWKGLGVEGYVGAPVPKRLDFVKNNGMAGARLFYRHGFDAELGVSYVRAIEGGLLAKNDVAVDGWWRLHSTLTLGLTGQWSLYEERFAEGRVMLAWQPVRNLSVTLDGQRTAPDLFLSRSSIFSTFSDEKRDELGGEIAVRLGPKLSAYVDMHAVKVEAGSGYRVGGKGVLKPFAQSPATSLGVETRFLKEPSNGFKQVRAYAMHKFPRQVSATFELDGTWLDQPINGRVRSLIALATLGWAFLPAWECMLAGSFGTTPYLDRRFEITARLSWKFGGPGGQP